MAKYLGNYINNYEDVSEIEVTQYGKIYSAFNKKENRKCCLKIISKDQLKMGDYNYLLERVNREEQLTKICKSKNVVELYQRFENENNIIFELEYCPINLTQYINSKGELEDNIAFMKRIILGIGNALKTIHKKGIMHRDIKTNNIFLDEDETTAKLGDFGCSIFIQDNTYESIGTILYTAPEILKNLKYNEKCDLWSLGVTLYELYFGFVPYGPNANTNVMMKYLSKKKLLLNKSKSQSFDILLNRLLQINPKERISFDEFFEIIYDKDFMSDEDSFLDRNNKYKYLYQEISNQPEPKYEDLTIQESDDKMKQNEYNKKQIMSFVKGNHFPDIMNFPNGSVNKEEVFNNIIYYDENIDYKDEVNEDSDYFERLTPGAFILCTNLDSLNLIKEEIITQNKKDRKTIFNMITTGRACDKIMGYLNNHKNFKKCINKVCIFCYDLDRWSKLKNKYDIIYNVYNVQDDVKEFIEKFSSKDIKPFPITKLITYYDYTDKYKDRHEKISEYYGDLTIDSYNKNMKKMKKLIKDDKKKDEEEQNILLKGFMTFEIKEDLKKLNELIITEYTKNTFYGDLNRWLMNSKMNSFEAIAYFTARLMYSLNIYGKDNKMYCDKDKKQLKRGIKIPYSCLLPYERAKGKIILLSSFTSTTDQDETAIFFSGREDSKEQYETGKLFSVIYIITNINKKNWIPNGIKVSDISEYEVEKEILYQPFSFYRVTDLKIDIKNYTADIYMETVGKTEILEEKIQKGKDIYFNENEGIMQVKK